jgi:4-amino-4-deoxy-L-arabinose transferase-like glycosyltransferase
VFVNYTIAPPEHQLSRSAISPSELRALSWAVAILCVLLLFANLGGAALFEPDEGRNAEKAREILLLRDWLTPHENFLPVLDKPMSFYWLVAVAYKLFGTSEWSARLPSALAALVCLGLVYRFARIQRGPWVARWSTLILLTSTEFFILARIVISDMTLTFFITLALVSFYSAVHSVNQRASLLSCLVMYTALALGTLIKGLAGMVVPGLVACFYLLLARRWRLWRELHVLEGAAIYLLLVLPWYVRAAAENPGYLGYFFWEEHLNRYLTGEFHRSRGWYYFVPVIAVGFLPWTWLLAPTLKRLWRGMDDRDLFLTLWAVVPFILFSVSDSKLPHYVLPIFPPLAMLSAETVTTMFSSARSKPWGLFVVWGVCAIVLLYFVAGTIAPLLITWRIREVVAQSRFAVVVATVLMLSIHGLFAWSYRMGRAADQTRAFICTGLTLSLFFFVVLQLQDLFSLTRSTKPLANSLGPFVGDNRLVLYNTYPNGLIFYLGVQRPVWVVAAAGKQTPVMDSPYLEHQDSSPVSRFGQVLFTAEEFRAIWSKAAPSLRVLVKEKQLPQFHEEVGATAKPLTKIGEYLLVAKQ